MLAENEGVNVNAYKDEYEQENEEDADVEKNEGGAVATWSSAWHGKVTTNSCTCAAGSAPVAVATDSGGISLCSAPPPGFSCSKSNCNNCRSIETSLNAAHRATADLPLLTIIFGWAAP